MKQRITAMLLALALCGSLAVLWQCGRYRPRRTAGREPDSGYHEADAQPETEQQEDEDNPLRMRRRQRKCRRKQPAAPRWRFLWRREAHTLIRRRPAEAHGRKHAGHRRPRPRPCAATRKAGTGARTLPKPTAQASGYVGSSASAMESAPRPRPVPRPIRLSCMGEGEDGIWTYDGFTVYTLPRKRFETVEGGTVKRASPVPWYPTNGAFVKWLTRWSVSNT